jgi:hypothetical protein
MHIKLTILAAAATIAASLATGHAAAARMVSLMCMGVTWC